VKSMDTDLELAGWRTDWLANEVSDAPMLRLDLHRLVERKRRRMALALAGQLLYALAMLLFSGWFAARRPTLEWILWAAVLWAGTFFATGFTIWNKSGTWQALGESNSAFLDLSRRRCLREWRAIHLGRWSLAAQLAIVAVWLSWDCAMHRLPVGPYLLGMAIAVVLAAVYLTWFAARERRIIRDIGDLDRFENELRPQPNE
jgi:hypothetical protein